MTPAEFYNKRHLGQVLDTRSPAEYELGHIPGAISFPLFSNQERAEIGKIYKEAGKENAVHRGMELVGPRLTKYIDSAKKISQGKELYIYCWRGGMRSKSLTWLLQTGGLKTHRLEGGYKAYRTWMYEDFKSGANYVTVGGLTGSAKTEILKELEKLGEQIIDLEDIAGHFGSAFGNLDANNQPSTEQFQNLLLDRLNKLDRSRIIWIEDESQHIGGVWINDTFFQHIKSCPLVIIKRSDQQRIQHLCKMYAGANKKDLIDSFEKIRKRLGGQNVKQALKFIEEGDFGSAAMIALHYYDKSYGYMLEKRACPKFDLVGVESMPPEIAKELIRRKKEFHV